MLDWNINVDAELRDWAKRLRDALLTLKALNEEGKQLLLKLRYQQRKQLPPKR